MISIHLTAQPVFHIGSVPITNSLLTAFVITLGFALFALMTRRKLALAPTRLQVALELAVEGMLDQLESAFNSKAKAKAFFPLLLTLVLFIAIANQFTLIPLVSNIMLGETNLFRLPTADLAQTVALALLMVGLSHVLALRISPLKHIGNFIKIAPLVKARSLSDFANALLGLFLGVLDIIGEFAKVLSLSFRLFGNIFAGEAIIAVIGGLTVFTSMLVPIPFIVLSIFSGFVQAFVFMLLSTQFIAGVIREEG